MWNSLTTSGRSPGSLLMDLTGEVDLLLRQGDEDLLPLWSDRPLTGDLVVLLLKGDLMSFEILFLTGDEVLSLSGDQISLVLRKWSNLGELHLPDDPELSLPRPTLDAQLDLSNLSGDDFPNGLGDLEREWYWSLRYRIYSLSKQSAYRGRSGPLCSDCNGDLLLSLTVVCLPGWVPVESTSWAGIAGDTTCWSR